MKQIINIVVTVFLFLFITDKIQAQSRNILININESKYVKNDDLLLRTEQILQPFNKENLSVEASLIKLDDNIAGDIEKIYTAKYEYALLFKDIISENTVLSETINLIGSGSNDIKAEQNILQQISKIKPVLQSKLKAKFDKRVPMDCGTLESIVNHLAMKNDFDRIISLHTQGCPNVEKQVLLKWQELQSKECQKMLQEVKAFVAVSDYQNAIHGIIKIDPFSNCKDELDTVIKSLENKYKSEEDKEYNLYLEYYRNQKNNPRELYPLFLMNFQEK